MTEQAPAYRAVEPFLCGSCNGSGIGWDRRACERCDGKGDTILFGCGHCCEVYDSSMEWHYFAGGEKRPMPRRVSYTIGGRRYEYCSDCAPFVAVNDGSLVRDMLRQITEIRADLDSNEPEARGRRSVVAAYLEMNIRLLAEWCGVETP